MAHLCPRVSGFMGRADLAASLRIHVDKKMGCASDEKREEFALALK
jgi:hypothetical protein